MPFDKYEDFYAAFNINRAKFDQAATYEEFCTLMGTPLWEHLKGYKWAPSVFWTLKAGKQTYYPLTFPRATYFEDLFDEARFLPASSDRNAETKQAEKDGFKWMSGYHDEVYCMHVGGERSWSKTCPNTRAHFGSKFYGTFVKPNAATAVAPMTLVSRAASYEAVKRDDGILIIAHDGLSIGRQWLALLSPGARIDGLLTGADRILIAREEEAEKMAWGEEPAETGK